MPGPVQPDTDLELKAPTLDSKIEDDNSAPDLDPCASAKKIKTASFSETDGFGLIVQSGFILIVSNILFEFLSSNMKSGECCH